MSRPVRIPPTRWGPAGPNFMAEVRAWEVSCSEGITPHSSMGGSVTHAEFLAGRYQGLVREHLGQRTVDAMRALIEAIDDHPTLGPQRRRELDLAARYASLPELDIDPEALVPAPRVCQGYPTPPTTIPLPGGFQLHYNGHSSTTHELELPTGGRVPAPGYLIGDGCWLESARVLAVVAGDQLVLVDADGRSRFPDGERQRADWQIGSAVRLSQVAPWRRPGQPEAVVVGYRCYFGGPADPVRQALGAGGWLVLAPGPMWRLAGRATRKD